MKTCVAAVTDVRAHGVEAERDEGFHDDDATTT